MRNEPPDLKTSRRNTPSRNGEYDRLPPNTPEMEQALLGCVLLDPNTVLPECIEKFKDETVFYSLPNQTIYKTLVELYDDQDPVEVLSLVERLKLWDLLEQVGGTTYVASLPDSVPSAANASYYIDIIREKFLMRQMIRACTETVARIYDYEGDVASLLDETERDILRIGESRVVNAGSDIRQLVTQSMGDIEQMQQRKGVVGGVATGFSDIDRITNGLQPGEMTVIAARPSVGKTSLAMNIAEFVAVENKIPVGVFSLEMTAKSLTTRMLCARARVNLRNVRDGFLAERDYPKLTGAAGRISSAPLHIDDTTGLSILQLRAKARRLWQRYGIKLFVIDYLQLLNAIGGKRRVESRQQEVADISAGIKGLAKELSVPVIVLSQLNRDLEKDKNRKPRLADLRESGAIEQDADVVGFLYKPRLQDDEEEGGPYEEAVPVTLLIAKQRNGPTGEVPLVFIKSYTRFESAAKITEEDVPEESQQSLLGQ